MPTINPNELTLYQLLYLAEEHGLEPCDYCQYRLDCNHNVINNYGYGPVESPCVDVPEHWVDEDDLREAITELLEDDNT